ncbi:pyrroline-5-carboxylate reductase [Demequina sp.]|uniref:pyrroline-5-carboxylate reductase n=1 Tax=Demequina sp. TaxID=2050685 RepID=UPI0025C2518E|nr:pyrroline-5-carboxylate reductase [Demequina sp.]
MTDTTPAPSSTIAIIGGGVMGGAIAAGVRNGGWPAEAVTVADRHSETLADLAGAHGLLTTTSVAEAAAGADVIVFAVKPQNAAEVLAEFGPHVKPGSMVLTIAAGLSASFYEARLPHGTPVVRAMPNTPALVGFGATAIAAGASATDAHLTVASRVLAATGLVVTVDEGQINAVSTVSGSGPAYFYAFVEAMVEAGITQGLDRDVASALARQTLIGAGRLLESSGATPAELRARVSSKGGTTLAALEAMGHAGLQTVVAVGLSAADRRARELAVELAGE